MFESRISVGASEQLPPVGETSLKNCRVVYNMEEHAQKYVENSLFGRPQLQEKENWNQLEHCLKYVHRLS